MAETPARREVLVIDDRPAMQDRFRRVVRTAFGRARLYSAKTLVDGERQAALLQSLVLVLLVLTLPGCKGIEALRWFRHKLPRVPVVVMSAKDDREAIISSLSAGAAGYIPKNGSDEVIAAALRLVTAGGVYVPSQVVAYVEVKAPSGDVAAADAIVHRLTGRQLEVLRLILDGRSNAEVARDLSIAEGTVKQHAHAIYETLGVSRRTQLLALAARGGIRRDGSPIT